MKKGVKGQRWERERKGDMKEWKWEKDVKKRGKERHVRYKMGFKERMEREMGIKNKGEM